MRRLSILPCLAVAIVATGCRSNRLAPPSHSSGQARMEVRQLELPAPGTQPPRTSYPVATHAVLTGTSYEIGGYIGQLAKDEGWSPTPMYAFWASHRERREYLEKHDPFQWEALAGIADHFDARADAGSQFIDIPYYQFNPAGGLLCSMAFYPPSVTASGNPLFLRNLDFSTGTLKSRKPSRGNPAPFARPYILELHPTETGRFSSIAVYSFDLLGGVVDGMNSEGLVVGLSTINKKTERDGVKRPRGAGMLFQPLPAFYELSALRLLLDRARNCDEAKALLKQITDDEAYTEMFMNLHFLVSDKAGNSFVFEYLGDRKEGNRAMFHKGSPCEPVVLTNHLLTQYPSPDSFPPSEDDDTFDRFLTLTNEAAKLLSTGDQKVSAEEAWKVQAAAFPQQELVEKGGIKDWWKDHWNRRTLWRSRYEPVEGRVTVDFYLADDPSGPGREKQIRSREFTFDLKQPAVSR